MQHLRWVTAATEKLRSEFDRTILALKAEHDSQVQTLKQSPRTNLYVLSFHHFTAGNGWSEKPDAFDFVIYRKDELDDTAAMWCWSQTDGVGRRSISSSHDGVTV
jgi:hypothetical protein